MHESDVIEQLNSAFDDVPRPPSLWHWTPEDLGTYLEDILELDPSEVHWLLPRILINIAGRHREQPYVSELLKAADFLNVGSSPPPPRDPHATADYHHVEAVLASARSRESKEGCLAYINENQAVAILHWLELVATWPFTWEDEVRAAMNYWRVRARTQS